MHLTYKFMIKDQVRNMEFLMELFTLKIITQIGCIYTYNKNNRDLFFISSFAFGLMI